MKKTVTPLRSLCAALAALMLLLALAQPRCDHKKQRKINPKNRTFWLIWSKRFIWTKT